MCDHYKYRRCKHPNVKPKQLTILLLDCWQREYDKRPYSHFQFKSIEFEHKMKRSYHPVKDFEVIVSYLHQRLERLSSVELVGFKICHYECDLLDKFALSLLKLRCIDMKMMKLPLVFFELLRGNGWRMKIKELSFEGTPLTMADISVLTDFIRESHTLKYFNVVNCDIDQYSFTLLADAIHQSGAIRSFTCNRLLGRGLTLDTMKLANVVSSLIWQNKLEAIEMQQCQFIAHDMETIGEYMARKDSKLMKLNLAYNKIASDGTEQLFRSIVHSGTLTHLNISGNSLGSHGGEIVAKYLSYCYRLQSLNITYNAIGHEAINAILTSMKKAIKLQRLELCGNHFNLKSAHILRRLLDARVVLQDSIDVTVTFDGSLMDFRVIPYF